MTTTTDNATIRILHGFRISPAAELFPMMAEDDLDALAEDIQRNGQKESITTFHGYVIDGRSRIIACHRAGVEPMVGDIDDDPETFDPFAYSISVNLHRRHLTESQRALVAARIEKRFKPAADKRRLANLKKGSDVPDVPDLEHRETGRSIERAAKALNVGKGSVANAKAVLEHGSSELIEAVEKGEVSVSKAAKVAKVSPPEIQMEEATHRTPKKRTKADSDDFCPINRTRQALKQIGSAIWDLQSFAGEIEGEDQVLINSQMMHLRDRLSALISDCEERGDFQPADFELAMWKEVRSAWRRCADEDRHYIVETLRELTSKFEEKIGGASE